MSERIKPPALFWVISILALLWNLMGVMAYLGMTMTPPEAFIEAYGQEYADVMASKPAWATAAFAIAVFGGLLGCVGLLLRKSWAKILFILSLLGVIVQNIWGFMSGSFNLVGTSDKVLTVLVLIVAVFLIWFAQKKTAKGYLN